MDSSPSIVVLTGAGISAESGISTFRTDNGPGPALWAEHDVDDIATPAGYRRNPELVHDFYRARRRDVAAAEPNAAHLALARLADELEDGVLVVTQNVDDLHERAGLRPGSLLHMHGDLAHGLCPGCGELTAGADYGTECPVCHHNALRPNVVWFGERPHRMGFIERTVSHCDMFIAVGTSGTVYPAANLVGIAAVHGIPTVELNLIPSEASFDTVMQGPASVTVPQLVEMLLRIRAE
jgi:NAD-dependent deacetylase